ncbi:MAG TPA: phage tail protein [Prolixibacteraceae bacterium]|nr:phage tail protein [Prolixibacteraceae bacterium]HCU60525.1 phage tail protein [Prolixibacteraceae bacterium]
MDPFIGTIQAFAFGFAPVGWVACWGQTLPVMGNQALFTLLGTTFGGDGRTTFGVPDLRGRTIIGVGAATPSTQVPGTSEVDWGEKGGAEVASVTASNMPMHVHQLVSGDGTGGTVKITTKVKTVNNDAESNESDNGANALGTGGNMDSVFRESPSGNDSLGGVSSSLSGFTTYAGGDVPMPIRNPYLGLYYCIATQGVYPPRP